ncbi:MAG: PD-(D/E)XK nuclease family protein [Syntrophomonadaceae bacterium]|nr:PD-(D/E)XK nuclease family protein [Syntrophomonadaceae bacterium]
MLNRILSRLSFSQLSFSTYMACQLKFRRRYVEQLYWPQVMSEEVELGQAFHTLSERYYLTGEMDNYPGLLGQWGRNLKEFYPYDSSLEIFPEQQVRFNGDIRLVAKYDLLVNGEKLLIYDWKTTKKIKRSYYENSLQTLLYRYLMAEAGGEYLGRIIKPRDIIMCYWNPSFPREPLYLPYDEIKYRRDGKFLRDIINEIMQKPWDEFFPVTDERICSYCEYSPICHGKPGEGETDFDAEDLSLSWDDIDEFLV